MAKEAPIFIHTHDMLAWLTDHLENWPRTQRFFLAREVMTSASAFYQLLLQARKVPASERGQVLLQADVRLEMLKAFLRLGHDKRYMSVGQYAHVSKMLVEIGSELGGWRKSIPPPGS